MSPGESLGLELDRRDSGVLDVVPLLRVSCLETRLGGPKLLSSDARYYPRLFCRGAMHTMASVPKTMPFSGRTKFRHPPSLGWRVNEESQDEDVLFGGGGIG